MSKYILYTLKKNYLFWGVLKLTRTFLYSPKRLRSKLNDWQCTHSNHTYIDCDRIR